MATQTTGGGSNTSFLNTPQAKDDTFWAEEDRIYCFDVMANDLGGNAKVLWSIDTTASDGVMDLLAKDAVAVSDCSELGAKIWITADGKIAYDTTALDHLPAGSGPVEDHFTYAIRLANGTLSWATVTVNLSGTNDGPVANADTGTAGENENKAFGVLANDTDVDDGAVLTLSSIDGVTVGGNPANAAEAGAFSIVANKVQFTPGSAFDHLAQGASATVVVSYTVQDEHGASSSSTMTITVTGTNDGPVAVADTAGAGENQTITVNVLANDTDVDDGHSFTLVSASAAAGKGSASVVGNQLQFNPGTDFDHLAQGVTEVVVVNYSMQDEHGASSSSTLTITVTGTNDTPIATAASNDVLEDATVSGNVSGTDADDGAVLSYALTGAAPAGLTFHSDGSYSFDASSYDSLAEDEPLVVVIPFTATDQHGATSAPANLTITITGTNDAPVVNDVSVTTVVEDGPAVAGSFSGDDVDSDDDGSTLVYSITSDPSEGSVINNHDGTFSFDPGTDFQDLAKDETRQVSFTYKATDGHGVLSNSGTVTVTVTGTNDDPLISIVGDDSAGETIDETNIGLTTSGTLTVTDADTSDVVDTAVTGVALGGDYGSLTEADVIGMLSLTGDVDLAANSADSHNLGWAFDSGLEAFDFLAVDQSLTLTYELTSTDDEGATDTQTVTITVTGTNDAPVAVADLADGNEDTTITGSVATNDSDVDDGASLAYAVSGVAPAGFSMDAAGDWSLNAANLAYQHLGVGESEEVVVNYTVTDEHGLSDAATLTITVHGENDAPTAAATKNVTTDEDMASSAVAIGATDIDGDTLSYSVKAGTEPLKGDVSFNQALGTFVYTPNANANGSDSFTILVSDGHGGTAEQVVSVTINPVNDAPAAAGVNSVTTDEDTASSAVAIGATDIDGDTLSYSVKAGFEPGKGIVTFDQVLGEFVYTPNANANGPDSFTILVSDGHGGTAEQVVSVTINPVNDAPTAAAANNVTTDEDTASSAVAIGATDIDGDTLSYSVKAGFEPGKGSVNFDQALGQFVYTPNPNANGSDSFTILVSDGQGGTAEQVVSVTINPVNDAPTAAATNSVTTDEDMASSAVAINATDIDGDTLSYSVKAGFEPGKGGVSFNQALGTFVYTPNANANGADGFTILVSDGHGGTAEQVISVTINPVNDAPDANDDAKSGNEDTTITGSVAGNDSDVDAGAVLGYAVNGISPPGFSMDAAGNWSLNASNAAYQHIALGASQDVVVSYTVTDEHGAPDTATLTITVNGVNDNPALTAGQAMLAGGTEDQSYLISKASLLTGFTDVDDGTVLGVLGLTANHGSVIDNGNGTYTITPEANYNGLVTLSYSVVDGQGGSVAATISFSLAAVNDPANITAVAGGDYSATEAGGVANGTAGDWFAGGQVSVTDVDVGEAVFQTPSSLSGTYGTFGFDPNSGQWTYDLDNGRAITEGLNVGSSVTDTLTVKSADGTATYNIVVTIAGTNDAAVITGTSSGTVVEATSSNAGTPTATGTLLASDVDNPPNTFLAKATTVTASGYGSYTMSAAGVWTYTLNNANPTVNALMTGMFLLDTFDVQSADGTTKTITVTINGADDVVVVTPPATFNGADPNDFDSLVGTGAASNNATINGDNVANDNITGGSADQNIDGKGGNDTIYAAGGDDDITGNNGDDTLYGQVGNDDISGNNGLDAIYGGSGIDTITGGGDADTIYGGSGNDIIDGAGDNDIIIGGYGADQLTGGGGDDIFRYLDLKDTNDSILDFMDSGNDQIDLSALDANGSLAGNQAFGWGGSTPTANSLWMVESGGNTTLFGDTDGNAATAEFMLTLPTFTGFDPLTPPPDITF